MKRSTETVLRGELAAATKDYGAAVARRDAATARVNAARAVLDQRLAELLDAKLRSERAVATLEAYLGEKLPDETAEPTP